MSLSTDKVACKSIIKRFYGTKTAPFTRMARSLKFLIIGFCLVFGFASRLLSSTSWAETTECHSLPARQLPSTLENKQSLIHLTSQEFRSYLGINRDDLLALNELALDYPTWPNSSCKRIDDNRGRCWLLNVLLPDLISDFRILVALSRGENRLTGEDLSLVENALNPRLLPPTFSPLKEKLEPLSESEKELAKEVLIKFWDGDGKDRIGKIDEFIMMLRQKIQRLSESPSQALEINQKLLNQFERSRLAKTAEERVHLAMLINDSDSGRAWIDSRRQALHKFHLENLAELWSLFEIFGPLIYIRDRVPTIGALRKAIQLSLRDNFEYQKEINQRAIVDLPISDSPATPEEAVGFVGYEDQLDQNLFWLLDHSTISAKTILKHPEFCQIVVDSLEKGLRQIQWRSRALSFLILGPLVLIVPEVGAWLGPVGSSAVVATSALATAAQGSISYLRYQNRLKYYLARRKSLSMALPQMNLPESERAGTVIRAQTEFMRTPFYLLFSVGGFIPRWSEWARLLRP